MKKIINLHLTSFLGFGSAIGCEPLHLQKFKKLSVAAKLSRLPGRRR